MSQLTDSLLLLARTDAGHALALAPLDLTDLAVNVSERVTARAHQRGVRLAVTLDSTAPVRGDSTWLTQLVTNLIDNAFRHTPAGGQVELSVERGQRSVILKVADSGEGIAPEHLPHLFERFYRADPARGRESGGAGLGLAICEWIAQAHGGQLSVESVVGRGTTFKLWLPVASPSSPQGRDGAQHGSPDVGDSPTSPALRSPAGRPYGAAASQRGPVAARVDRCGSY